VFDCVEFLVIFRGRDLSCDPYSLYLKNMHTKRMLTTTFDHSKDFQWHSINLVEHLLLFHGSYLSAFIHIHLSCMLRCLISFCEL